MIIIFTATREPVILEEKAKTVHFSVHRTSSFSEIDATISFESEKVNEGGAMNVATGVWWNLSLWIFRIDQRRCCSNRLDLSYIDNNFCLCFPICKLLADYFLCCNSLEMFNTSKLLNLIHARFSFFIHAAIMINVQLPYFIIFKNNPRIR